jgi:hypothetical protein
VNLAAAKALATYANDDGPRSGGGSTPQPTPTQPPATPSPTQAPSTPTPQPTQPAPTATPVPPTPAPTQPGPGTGWSLAASASPGNVNAGSNVTLSTTIKAPTAGIYLVDMEVYDASGKKVFQKWWDRQSFRAGQQRPLTETWTVPSSLPKGTYTIKIAVFGSGWNGLKAWTDSAKTFTVN